MAHRILIIEDDVQLAAQIVGHLQKAGFITEWWAEGRAIDANTAASYSLLILDLMLPNSYGMDILKDARRFTDVPVLILSARNDTLEKVRALKLGADDYMTKPFWPEELLERVRARLRRPTMQKDGALSASNINLDLTARTVAVEGASVDLTRVEFDILAALMRRPNAAVSRQWLVDHVLDPEREGTERTLDVHVSRLRKKLGTNNPIETVWGIGYRLRGEELT